MDMDVHVHGLLDARTGLVFDEFSGDIYGFFNVHGLWCET